MATPDLTHVRVYGLFSTRDGEIRYIGQTKQSLLRRIYGHRDLARKGDHKPLYAWMRQEVADGHQVDIFLLRDGASWNRCEIEAIAAYRQLGAKLLNILGGGPGSLGHKHSQETKAKRSAALTGLPFVMTDRRVAQYARGKTPEHIAKIAAANIGRKLSPEAIARRTATRHERANYKWKAGESRSDSIREGQLRRAASRSPAEAAELHQRRSTAAKKWRAEKRSKGTA